MGVSPFLKPGPPPTSVVPSWQRVVYSGLDGCGLWHRSEIHVLLGSSETSSKLPFCTPVSAGVGGVIIIRPTSGGQHEE